MKLPCQFSGLLANVLLVATVLLAAALASAQGGCVGCREGQCAVANAGGCLCVMGGGICQTCGACTYGTCFVPCKENPNTSDTGAVPTSQGAKARMDPPTSGQLSSHSWISDDAFPLTVAKRSQVLGSLIGKEQRVLRTAWCTNFVRGHVTINPEEKPTIYKWELIFRSGADEFRVKRLSDGGDEQGIIITSTRWILYRGDDFDNIVAQGSMGEPHPQQ
jgi:hypothetical protein